MPLDVAAQLEQEYSGRRTSQADESLAQTFPTQRVPQEPCLRRLVLRVPVQEVLALGLPLPVLRRKTVPQV